MNDDWKWLAEFDDRQRKEIGFSRIYADQFGHGTEGHNAKLIIAKMAWLLDAAEVRIDHLAAQVQMQKTGD